MNRKLALVSLLALAATSLSGCVAAAIPAIAGSAIFGSRIDGKDAEADSAPAVAAANPEPAPAVVRSVTVTTATPAPVSVEPMVKPPMAAPPPAPAVSIAATPAIVPPPAPPAIAPVPASPTQPEQLGFAQFVRYGRAIASTSATSTAPLSAVLSDPIALDGKRRSCKPGEQPVALIDLDPEGSIFAPPDNPAQQPGLALGLAVLREAGVVIAWLTDLSVDKAGALRTALEQSGLDPRGEDIISLRSDTDDRKQLRKDNLAANACIIAIAGDERPDFDERYKYLRNPEAGAELEPVIGNGWFLIGPLFGKDGMQGQ